MGFERLMNVRSCVLFAALALLSACDSGSSAGSSDQAGPVSFSGTVVDGPVVGATVELVDANGQVVTTTQTAES